VYQDDKVTAHWDVPIFEEHLQVRANRVDATFVDRENKEAMLIEMSCPWMDKKQNQGSRFDSSISSSATLSVAIQGFCTGRSQDVSEIR